MISLITVKRGKRIIAQCDERCYEANIVGEGCDCVCMGLLHGLGFVQAANKLIEVQNRIEQNAYLRYTYAVKVEFNVSAYQPKLPLF